MSRPRTQLGPCIVTGCASPKHSRGMCKRHYGYQWEHAGRTTPPTLRERFETRFAVHEPTGCWLWTAEKFNSGYGRISVRQKKIRAHRLAYELYVGPIAEGLHVLHRCDVPACVNPAHLFLGTHIDNMRDMERKGRAKWVQQNIGARQA